MKPLSLSFIPRSANCALLFLRLWFGLAMLFNHGWAKLVHFSAMKDFVPNPLHLETNTNMVLAVICEVVCPILVVFGFLTRLGALITAAEMAIAFILVHHHAMSGPHSGELPFLYFGGFFAIFLLGSGRCAVDAD
ncbi:MAG TPA: DoxX family protein [Opitutaceae bacterium]|jgi:putative oxidoreductase|nr:DoxX family protein [Opitutaceae bacterium]